MNFKVGTARAVAVPWRAGGSSKAGEVSVPEGRAHAVDAATGEAACGTDEVRAVFDWDWERATGIARCDACRLAVSAERGQA